MQLRPPHHEKTKDHKPENIKCKSAVLSLSIRSLTHGWQRQPQAGQEQGNPGLVFPARLHQTQEEAAPEGRPRVGPGSEPEEGLVQWLRPGPLRGQARDRRVGLRLHREVPREPCLRVGAPCYNQRLASVPYGWHTRIDGIWLPQALCVFDFFFKFINFQICVCS